MLDAANRLTPGYHSGCSSPLGAHNTSTDLQTFFIKPFMLALYLPKYLPKLLT